MRSGRPLVPFELSESTRKQLQSLVHSRSTPQGLVRRAEIVLLAADGWPNLGHCQLFVHLAGDRWKVAQALCGARSHGPV